ncbi:MAG: hypothetical protein OHK0031_00300 [Anaerolineales bacterium]
MKTKLWFVLAILSLLVSAVGVAAAPAAPLQKAKITGVTLVETTFMHEKGLLFRFKVSGTFENKDLKGWLFVADKDIKLYCRYQSKLDLVQCNAPGGTSKNYAGQTGVVSLNDYRFTVIIPDKRTVCPSCGYNGNDR